MKVALAPILDADLEAAGAFIHDNLTSERSPHAWANDMRVPWKVDAPNHGYMMWSGDRVVGVYLAIYSDRLVDGQEHHVCNLSAWCVLPEFRFAGVRLLRALLAQEGYTFTDLSPSGNVPRLNTRMGFQTLDTAASLSPNLPWPAWRGQGTVTSDPAEIERTLSGRDLEIYLDHADSSAVQHLLLRRGGEHCHVIVRRENRRMIRRAAVVMYASNPELLHRMSRPLARHLLLRHFSPVTVAELRIIGGRLPLSRLLSAADPTIPKMFKSQELEAHQIDYLYSELVRTHW